MWSWPILTPAVQHAIQVLYGGLLLVVLAHQFAPHWRRFFLTERHGGYLESGPLLDALHHPRVIPWVGVLWAVSAIALIGNQWAVLAGLANVVLCRHHFIALRWHGVQRGYGAPGFMTYWLGLAVFLLVLTRQHAPALQPLAVLYLQVDFALIIFSSGFYKFRAGYPQGDGIDYGLTNPMWCYWPDFFRRLPPRHGLFRSLNHAAWLTQLGGAALMLFPATRWVGGALEVTTYLFLVGQIRLGWLAEMMMVCGLFFFTIGSPPAGWLDTFWPAPSDFTTGASLPWLTLVLTGVLWLQLGLIPLVHAGLFYNYYGRRRLPVPFQRALETYANFFGIIVWRVFSVDHLNFHVNIHRVDADGRRTHVSEWRNPRNLRFWHVGEAITVTSLFTTLKYYPADNAIFRARVLRYARTLPCAAGEELIFSYHATRKERSGYTDRLVCEYHVAPQLKTIRIVVFDPAFSPTAAHAASPLHPAAQPGSYAPPA